MDKRRNNARPRVFQAPDQLWQEFLDYVEFTKANPLIKTHFVGKDGKREHEEIPAPLTYKGFQVFLWDKGLIGDLTTYERDENYFTTISRIRANCQVHNVKWALVGQYKENLVARIEGIKEQTETENKHTITKVDINIKRADE